jgi:hypothetical protein
MMNERIKELAEQATKKYDRLGNEIPFAQPDLEKFAQLIVFECVKIAVFKGDATTGKAIKEHFGVEQ